MYEIGIRDNGTGIPDEIKGRIFEPLFSTKDFGIGLGMVIVRNIVQQHHGTLSVDSKEGEGTTITVRLPVKVNDLVDNSFSI